MQNESDRTGLSLVWLGEAADRLSCYLGDFTRFALNDISGRKNVPVLAIRSDLLTMLPDRVEELLHRARKISVVSHNNEILADYEFHSEQEADQLFGPRSNWRHFADPNAGRIALKFERVQVCWTALMRELRQIGWGPADEAGLRKLGLWRESWSADEARHVNDRTSTRGSPEVGLRLASERQATSEVAHADSGSSVPARGESATHDIKPHPNTRGKGGRPEIYGEGKQQVIASLNAWKVAHGLAWLDVKRPGVIEALLRAAVKKPLPGRTRLREWIGDWRTQQSDSTSANPVCR
jgi:hypothetical protein